jgi:hypothetical protein
MVRLQDSRGLAHIPVITVPAQDLPQDDFVPGTNALELAQHRPLMMYEVGNVIRSILENVLTQYPRE